MSALPWVPWDIIEVEIPQWLQFGELLILARVCCRLNRIWKRWVKELPAAAIKRCNSEKIASFTSLSTLVLDRAGDAITDQGLFSLTALTSLDLKGNRFITDQGLSSLTNLTHLKLGHNSNITDRGVIALANLTSLKVVGNKCITNSCIASLSKLTSLDLGHESTVAGGLSSLTNLTYLHLRFNTTVTDLELSSLTSLKSLHVGWNTYY